SYQSAYVGRVSQSRDTLIYIKNPCRINGALMRTILITGGAGFIGANLVKYLTEKYPEDRMVVLDILTYAGSVENLPKDMLQGRHPLWRFWYGNVCNAALLDTLVNVPDLLLHLPPA